MATAAPPSTASTRTKRVVWFLLPGVAFVALLAVAVARTDPPPAPGDPAPAFEAPLLDGDGLLSLAELEGRPVVLNFWASWCAPCEEEAPVLNEAHEVYGDEIAIVGVDIRDSATEASKFVERFRVEYPSVIDRTGEIEDAYGLTGQPETFFVDADGIIVDHVPGPFSDREQLFARLDVLVSRDA